MSGLPEIFVMGCRNPWRLNIDPRSGYLYWGDVGPDAGGDSERGPRGHDEINQARKAGFFGWPYFIANNLPYADFDFISNRLGSVFDRDKPVNHSVNNTGARELPPPQPAFIYYPSAASEKFPELSSGGRTACAGPVFYADKYPQSATSFPSKFDHSLFFFEWSRNAIFTAQLDKNENLQSISPFLPAERFTRPIDMQFDRKGNLFVLVYGETWGVNPDAALLKIDYKRGNRTPVAKIHSITTAGREPLTIQLNAKDSYDKDGDRCTYAWRVIKSSGGDLLNANATIAPNANQTTSSLQVEDNKVLTGAEELYELSLSEPGVYFAELTVTDADGAFDRTNTPVFVGNSLPSVTFEYPRDGDFFTDGLPIEYKLQVVDREDGALDPDMASDEELEQIDSDAPKRIGVRASIVGNDSSNLQAAEPAALTKMRSSDCLNCHALDRPLVGPKFLEIADKYRSNPAAMEASIDRVIKGSSGVWGKVPMLPHEQLGKEQIREMIKFIYDAKPDQSTQLLQGPVNVVDLPARQKEPIARIRLEGNYTDLGRGLVPPQTGSSAIYVRSRTLETELADAIHGPQVMGSHRASNGQFIGGISHANYIAFNNIRCSQFHSITCRVTSAGAGGRIEVHADEPKGPLLATIPVKVNGDWDGWYDATSESIPDVTLNSLSTNAVTTEQLRSLFFVFVNDQNQGGLMNVDSFRLNP